MKRKLIKTKMSTDNLSIAEIRARRKALDGERSKSKIDLGDGRNLVKVEKTGKELEKPDFKPSLIESEIAKALRSTLGNHSQAARVLNVSQSAISQRVARSKKLQEVIRLTRNRYIDMAENIIRKRLKSMDFEAATLVIKRLGYMRHWIERQEIDVDQRVRSGVMVVPPQFTSSEEFEKVARKNQQELEYKEIHGFHNDEDDEDNDVEEQDFEEEQQQYSFEGE